MRPRVLIYVQHLLGVGHLMRTAAIAKATAAKDMDVLIVSGGMPHPDIDLGHARLFQLPPLRTEGTTYTTLVDEQDRPIDDKFKSKRTEQLLDCLRTFHPHLVITEHFPFGRGKLRFELRPLLDTVQTLDPKPLLFASVRDIIEPPESDTKRQRFLETANAFYDAILVHGDPDFASFGLSFPDMTRLRPIMHYTGYVGAGADTQHRRENKILISVGNGRTGGPLIRTLFDAHKRDDLGMQWEVRMGRGFPADLARQLRSQAAPGFALKAAAPQFADSLAAAALSVSQAGYNTVVDLAISRTPAVLVPYGGHGEQEQPLRAAQFSACGHGIVMEEKSLSPDTLLPAMTEALERPVPSKPPFRLGGATQTANLIEEAIQNTGSLIV